MARNVVEAVSLRSNRVLAKWLEISWQPIRRLLDDWTVNDLCEAYPRRFRGRDYLMSRQSTLWRILSHDIHYAGQPAMMLALQAIEAFEPIEVGGHIAAPAIAKPAL